MKRFLTVLVIAAMFLTLCIPTSATEAAKAEDVTARIKAATAFDIYEGKLPVVRMDATFVPSTEYTNDTTAADWKAPGSGTRECWVIGDTGWTNLFDDKALTYMDYEAACWNYDCIWSNIEKMTYSFTVPADGNYEFVVAGCAQITAENVDNDAKDRGFCLSVDGGAKVQVNIADTKGIFRDYTYMYNYEDLKGKTEELPITNGVNSQVYQMTYYYGEGLTMYLTAGTHTLEYWTLEYSGDAVTGVTEGMKVTSPRLNYYGTYVQKALSQGELDAYVFSDATTYAPKPEETPAPETTKADETTEAEKDETTAAPEDDATKAPETNKDPETTKAPESKGCGGFIGGGAVLLTAICATGIIIRRRK